MLVGEAPHGGLAAGAERGHEVQEVAGGQFRFSEVALGPGLKVGTRWCVGSGDGASEEGVSRGRRGAPGLLNVQGP